MVRYKSFDGTEIPAILYQPHGATAAKKAPAIVRVHGGPGGQARMPYIASVQFLVNHGYVVLDMEENTRVAAQAMSAIARRMGMPG